MKNLKLRKQTADCLRFLKQKNGWMPPRENVEEHIGTWSLGSSLADILAEHGSSDNIIIECNSYEDHDGYNATVLEILKNRMQTDDEYFDMLGDMIMPTESQQAEYNQYLRLKQKFETS